MRYNIKNIEEEIDDIMTELQMQYQLKKATVRTFFDWHNNKEIMALIEPFTKDNELTEVDFHKMLSKVEKSLEEKIHYALDGGDYQTYFSARGEVFGIFTRKDVSGLCVCKFRSLDKAHDWLSKKGVIITNKQLVTEKDALEQIGLSNRYILDIFVKMCESAETKANAKYDKKNTRSFCIKVNRVTETALLDKLESCDNVSQYIKSLIKQDIEKSNV